jgi:hypothetical protein
LGGLSAKLNDSLALELKRIVLSPEAAFFPHHIERRWFTRKIDEMGACERDLQL